MAHDSVNPNSHERPFESDTQRIVRRHLENKDDVIKEEDIASIRIGMTPAELDLPTQARFSTDAVSDDLETKYLGNSANNLKEENSVPS